MLQQEKNRSESLQEENRVLQDKLLLAENETQEKTSKLVDMSDTLLKIEEDNKRIKEMYRLNVYSCITYVL